MPRKKESILEDIRKEQIYEGALEIIATKGSANTTLDQVAKAAGLSKGGITYYYSSKYELFHDVFTTFAKQAFDFAKEQMDEVTTPIEKITTFLWMVDESNPHCQYLYPLFFDCMSLAVTDSDYRDMFNNWIQGWVELISAALETTIENPEERERTARAISSLSQGIFVRWYLDRDNYPAELVKRTFQSAIHKMLVE